MTNQINQFISASTIHDPDFRLERYLNEAMPLIKDLFADQCICYTPPTSEKMVHYLEEHGFKTTESKTMRQIDTYKQVITHAKEQITNPPLEFVFYIDFDRLIHWVLNFPKELKDLFLNFKGQEFLHIGRSKRAFATHPATQQETERIINRIGSKVLDFPEPRDIISVCYILNKRIAEKIIKLEHITTTGFYCTWPLLFWQWGKRKDYIEVGGLEWETPDQYMTEIDEMGYENWLEHFQSQKEWIKRANMLDDGLTELFNLINVDFLPEF